MSVVSGPLSVVNKMKLQAPVKISDWQFFITETPLAVLVLLLLMLAARFIILVIIRWLSG
jgi:hypothetical protein